MNNNNDKIRIIPLGGVQEIGMNMTVIEYGNELLIVDCGFMFPRYHMLGIDYVIPDTSYLEDKNIIGLILTHGHEDHIGAIPHFLRKFPDIPIYGSRLTLAFLRAKLNDYKNEYKDTKLYEVEPRNKIQLGMNFDIEFIRVNHSIPDGVGIAITTPLGVIIHTGDFKIDLNPTTDKFIDLYKFAEYGENGVLLMLADSTNCQRDGFSMSESVVQNNMTPLFAYEDGMIIAYSANPFVSRAVKGLDNVITFGLEKSCDYAAINIEFDHGGLPTYELYKHGEQIGTIHLSIPGEHNILNSLAAIACADMLGIEPAVTKKTLAEFKGTERRFDILGTTAKGAKVVDDYAHHPTEIRATLSAAHNIPHKKMWVLFQPHTYTRTIALFDEFAASFGEADCVVLVEIYAAREKNIHKISSSSLVPAIKKHFPDKEVHYFPTFEEIAEFVNENSEEGDLIITMGAGDVYKIGEMLIEKGEE